MGYAMNNISAERAQLAAADDQIAYAEEKIRVAKVWPTDLQCSLSNLQKRNHEIAVMKDVLLSMKVHRALILRRLGKSK